jgi:outer membrane protein assembly factor BamD
MKYIFIFIFFVGVSCSSKEKEIKTAANEYIKAIKILEDKRYIEAAEKFEAIYDDYPLSKWSIKAGSMSAYAYYKEDRYEDVIRVAETFIQLNPSSEYIPYLQYMKSISYFNMIVTVSRGQNYTQMASYNFRELKARFPSSEYAKDAKIKISIIDEHLAASKMAIGRYQIKSQNYIGAILHFNDVIYKYSNTNQSDEAYFRLYEIYYKLGAINKADRVKKEMLESHKDSKWLEYMES